MDFFQHQEDARKRSRWLLVLFAMAVLLIQVALNAVVWLYFDYWPAPSPEIEHWSHIIATTLGLLCILGGSLWRSWQLRLGGPAVAERPGARLARRSADAPEERVLLNVVEEMAIAAGLPVPGLYVLPQEMGINACAAGLTPGDAVICVTEGCLRKLNRDQLQAVIAHEFSHILYGDMRLNLRLVAVLHGILMLSIVGLTLLKLSFSSGHNRNYHSRGRRQGGGLLFLLGIGAVLWLIGSIGKLMADGIKAAVNRQREYLADAAAVQFTRNPDAVADVLKRIAVGLGSRVSRASREEFSHLFFGASRTSYGFSFASHPPIEARIRAVLPDWDGSLPAPEQVAADDRAARLADEDLSSKERRRLQSIENQVVGQGVLALMAHIGSMSQSDVSAAGSLLSQIPGQLREAAHDVFSARAIVYGLLVVDADREQEERLLQVVGEHADPLVANETRKLIQSIRNMPVVVHLPLLETCLPTLRLLTKDQYQRFRRGMQQLIAADDQVTVSEYAVFRLVRHSCDALHRDQPAAAKHIMHNLRSIAEPLACVLTFLALEGHKNRAQAQAAYAEACKRLDAQLPTELPEHCRLRDFDAALKRLDSLHLGLRRRLLDAFAICVSSDDQISPPEWALLRLLAAILDCPLPLLGKRTTSP